MLQFKVIERNFAKLQKIVSKSYLSDCSMTLLENGINNRVKHLLIENPYVDKDYRSIYYSDLSKRHREYSRDVCRVHLYSQTKGELTIDSVDKGYLGFFTLRESLENSIGRSYIDPKALKSVSGWIMKTKFKAHVFGKTMDIFTFPWMQQDINISRCAHVSLWSIMRYFGRKNRGYPNFTLGKLVELVKSDKRKIPSNGLTILQAVQALSDFGFSTEIFARSIVGDKHFNQIIQYYIESGIPIMAALAEKAHAVTLVGHGMPNSSIGHFNNDKNAKIVDSFELVESWLSVNDNFLPFSKLTKINNDHDLCMNDISAIAVPLNDKMYITPANIINNYLPSFESKTKELKNQKLMRRVFMTSAKKLKKTALQFDSINYKQFVLSLRMPKFIWVIEYSTPENYEEKRVDYRVVIDSTATVDGFDAVMFFQGKNVIIANEKQYNISDGNTPMLCGNLKKV